MKKALHFINKQALLWCLFLISGVMWGQTYYDMSTANYSQNFDGINTLPTNFSTVAVLNIGSIPVATKTTTASLSSLSVVGSAAAIGIDASTSTSLVFLTTGGSDNSTATATDLNLNFTNRAAGNLSYDIATISNGSGNRAGSLRVYYSLNNTSWTELTGTNLPYLATNNVTGSGTVNILLPSALNNIGTVKLRFYYHNGSGGTTGSRPRIGMDNLSVTSIPLSSVDPLLSISGTLSHGSSCNNTAAFPIIYTITNTGQTAATGISVVSSGTNSGDFVVSGLSSTTIAASGGTATYNVTFTPSNTGSRLATITVASTTTGSNSPTSSLTGIGTASAAATVTTSAATGITAKTATLNGSVTNTGVCPAISEKGFVYSITSINATPTEAGIGVTKQIVAGTSTGAYTFGLTNLPSSTAYSFRSYVFNGSTYVYGTVQSFTTSPALILTGTLGHGSICPTLSTGTITYTITNNGATSADGIEVNSSNVEFVVSNLSSTSIAPSGTATYQVTFTPATSGAKTATITVSSTNVASVTNSLTGSGTTIVAQAVVTNAAASITVNGANLKATSSTFGICPATTAKGFVYSVTSLNSDPLVGGSNVQITSVPLGSQGAFNQTVTSLSSGENYSYKAYLFNGTSYTYGAVQTFTTFAPPINDNCTSATNLIVNAIAISGELAYATQSIPAITCAGSTGFANDDVWYKFTTSVAGTYTITVDGGNNLDLVLDAREGSCNGTNIGCVDTIDSIETLTLSLAANTTYSFRVYDYTSTNFTSTTTFSVQVGANSSLSSAGITNLSFANQHITSNSTSQTINVSGQFLTGFPGVVSVASSNTDFQVSTNNSDWNSSITLPYSSDQLASVPVYVRFTPQTTGVKTANLTLSGGGATPIVIALNGTGIFVATAATNTTATSFDANWQVVQTATSGYLLDVSTSPTFGTFTSGTLTEGFDNGNTAPTGWNFSGLGSPYTSSGNFGLSSPSLKFDDSNDQVITSVLSGNATELKFWLKAQSTNATSAFLVEGYSGSTWVTIENITDISGIVTYTYNSSSTIILPANITQFRFTYTKSAGNVSFDDVNIMYGTSIPDLVDGYNPKIITDGFTVTSAVTGLNPETQYYYRLRAVNGAVESGNSNVISVMTTSLPAITWNGTAWSNTTGPTALIDAIIDADYNETDPITAKNLTINTGKVLTVKPANTLKVAGNLTNNGSIIFKSDATGTASFASYTGVAIAGSGTSTVERYIPAKRAWRLLTAPLKGNANTSISSNWQGTNGEGLLLFSPASLSYTGYVTGGTLPNIRKYNVGYQDITDLTTEPLFGAAGTDTKSFLVFATGPVGSPNIVTGATATTLKPTGQLITGDVNHASLAVNTFHILSNPYASSINPVSLIANNPTQKLWLIEPSLGSFGAYVTYDGQNWSIPTPTGTDALIQSGQGFFTRSAEATTFSINESNKAAGSSNTWFAKNADAVSTVENANKIRVLLYKQIDNNWKLADAILSVNYNEGSNDVNAMDSNKISNFNESIMFRNNTTNLSIEHRALPLSTEIQPLRLTGTSVLQYQLRVYTENYTNSLLIPVLEDTLNGTFTEIPMDGSVITIPFTGVVSSSTNPDNRFQIVYQTNLSTVGTSKLVASVFPNPVTNNQLNVNLGTNTIPADYTITNLLGQAIQKGKLAHTQNVIQLSASQGFYILNITQEGKTFTTKIYVQ